MSKKCTALAKPMEPLFSVAPEPRWKPGDLLKMSRIWALRQWLVEDLKTRGLVMPEKDGVML